MRCHNVLIISSLFTMSSCDNRAVEYVEYNDKIDARISQHFDQTISLLNDQNISQTSDCLFLHPTNGGRCPDKPCPAGQTCKIISNGPNKGAWCVKECKSDAECPDGYGCNLPPIPPDTIPYVCEKGMNPRPPTFGSSCDEGEKICQTPFSCITDKNSWKYCSKFCETDADCPSWREKGHCTGYLQSECEDKICQPLMCD